MISKNNNGGWGPYVLFYTSSEFIVIPIDLAGVIQFNPENVWSALYNKMGDTEADVPERWRPCFYRGSTVNTAFYMVKRGTTYYIVPAGKNVGDSGLYHIEGGSDNHHCEVVSYGIRFHY